MTERHQPYEIDDLELRRAQQGDAAACRALVMRHQRRVLGQLRAMLIPAGRGGLVEDLAQETFLRAFRALPRFRGDGRASLATWLVTIATRVALNELRRRPPRVEALDTVTESVKAGETAVIERHASGRAIEQAIADLPPAYRGAFLLRELHGLDYGEIAKVLEIDVGTVKSRLSRARARLRQALAEVQDG
ncbi:RNA polymerase sigma factor [Paraliomyxa miuraensis]|uniref:RNA polymerase sigma factor n=1 Tax=Paraliomyxa miuraensis TaxID=376150 RepID=UPI0022517C41|nr:sigma-70 family RNA polymerase sigma factor [Paraliomyxa miuraensis]MCX4245379.1 sigma-70 family RNA polymerase sigma factor [Paraliomyxa miuraensis]